MWTSGPQCMYTAWKAPKYAPCLGTRFFSIPGHRPIPNPSDMDFLIYHDQLLVSFFAAKPSHPWYFPWSQWWSRPSISQPRPSPGRPYGARCASCHLVPWPGDAMISMMRCDAMPTEKAGIVMDCPCSFGLQWLKSHGKSNKKHENPLSMEGWIGKTMGHPIISSPSHWNSPNKYRTGFAILYLLLGCNGVFNCGNWKSIGE